MQVQAQLKDGGRVVAVDYEFGENLDDAVARFGSEVVFTKFRAAAIIDLQALVRRHIKLPEDKAMTDEQIQAKVNGWKPAVAVVGQGVKTKPTAESLFAKAATMSAEEKQALLAKLQAQLGG
jgi:hypothetical protein